MSKFFNSLTAKLQLDEYKTMTLFVLIILMLNSLGSYFSFIPAILAIIEIVYLLYLFVKKDTKKYVAFLLIFTITSMERVGMVTGNLYSIMYIPFVRGYHYYILLFLPFLIIIKDYKFLIRQILSTKKKAITIFVFGLMAMFVLNLLTSVVTFFVDDNALVTSGYFFLFFRRTFLSNYTIICVIVLMYYHIFKYNDFIGFMKKILISIALAIVLNTLFCALFNCVYQYGKTDILMLTLSNFYLPMFSLFIFFKDYKKNKVLFILISIIAILFSILYPSVLAGKWWMVIIATIILIFIYSVKPLYKKNKKLFITASITGFVLLLILLKSNVYMLIDDPLLQGKLIQVVKLFDIGNPDWFSNIPSSPRFRIEEFINVMGELINKPLYLIQGKGMAGSVVPMYNEGAWYDLGAFTAAEIQIGIFYNVHETINVLALRSGLIGISFFMYFILKSILNLYKSPWLIIGVVWFVFYLTVFPTLWFGLIAFMIGLIEIDKGVDKYENF